jgi:hypothetical protein
VIGISMAYLEAGLKKEDFNGLPGGITPKLVQGQGLLMITWRLVLRRKIILDYLKAGLK